MYHVSHKSHTNVIGITIKDQLGVDDMKTLLPFMRRSINTHGKIRLLLDLRDFQGVESKGVLKIFRVGFKQRFHVEKKAIIADQHWIYLWGKCLFLFSKTEVRCFPSHDEEKAWEWISK